MSRTTSFAGVKMLMVGPRTDGQVGRLGGADPFAAEIAPAPTVVDRPNGWRLLISVAVSLALHLFLLSGFFSLRLPPAAEAPFVAVSLITAGGQGRARGGGESVGHGPRQTMSGDRGETARAAEKMQPEAVVPEKRPEAPLARRPRAATVEPRPKSPAPRELVRRDAAAVDPALARAAEGAQNAAGGGPIAEHLGSTGWGGGRGDGAGAGTGRGSGLGSGSGPGAGAGSGDGVDLRLACVHCPAPRYPRRAAARGVEGMVNVGFSIAADGTVREVVLRRSSGNRDLDEAAIEAARRSRFERVAAGGSGAARGYIAYEFQLARAGP